MGTIWSHRFFFYYHLHGLPPLGYVSCWICAGGTEWNFTFTYYSFGWDCYVEDWKYVLILFIFFSMLGTSKLLGCGNVRCFRSYWKFSCVLVHSVNTVNLVNKSRIEISAACFMLFFVFFFTCVCKVLQFIGIFMNKCVTRLQHFDRSYKLISLFMSRGKIITNEIHCSSIDVENSYDRYTMLLYYF